MKVTIVDILNELKSAGRSLSEGRRLLHMEGFFFNGEPVDHLGQEVELKEGDIFAVGHKWEWIRGTTGWIKRKSPPRRGIDDNEGSILMGDYWRGLAELAYWTVDEWEESGADVMGAIIGAMCEGFGKQRGLHTR